MKYKGVNVGPFGLPVMSKSTSKRDKKERVRSEYNSSFENPFNENSSKDLLIVYDIPESKKRERDWFRRQLKKFGYILIQRSVWVGPSPLPNYFLKYIKEIGIEKSFISFKLAKSYSSKTNLLN
jgi:CRISPR-associated endonuclease Cas2